MNGTPVGNGIRNAHAGAHLVLRGGFREKRTGEGRLERVQERNVVRVDECHAVRLEVVKARTDVDDQIGNLDFVLEICCKLVRMIIV